MRAKSATKGIFPGKDALSFFRRVFGNWLEIQSCIIAINSSLWIDVSTSNANQEVADFPPDHLAQTSTI
jgi:hypothetical protein